MLEVIGIYSKRNESNGVVLTWRSCDSEIEISDKPSRKVIGQNAVSLYPNNQSYPKG